MPLLTSIPGTRPRLILADVDDTLAASTMPILPPMAQALEALYDAGSRLIFVSGGSVVQMRGQVSQQLNCPHVLLGTSGAHAVDVDEQKRETEIFKLAFSEQDRADILASLQDLIARFDIKTDTTAEDQLQDRGTQFTLSAIGRHAAEERKRAFDPDGSRRRDWVRHLESRLGAGRFSIKAGGTTSVDITPMGVDKGTGLRKLLPLLKAEPSQGLFFGDRFEEMGNDRPVLAVMDCLAVKGPHQTLAYLHALLALNHKDHP